MNRQNPILKQLQAFAKQRQVAYQKTKNYTIERAEAVRNLVSICQQHMASKTITTYIATKAKQYIKHLLPPTHSKQAYWNQKIDQLLQP